MHFPEMDTEQLILVTTCLCPKYMPNGYKATDFCNMFPTLNTCQIVAILNALDGKCMSHIQMLDITQDFLHRDLSKL
jgi:hypothetical protein